MKKVFILGVVLTLNIISCSRSAESNSIIPLKNKKYSIDSLINKHRKLAAMAKTEDSEALVAVPTNTNVKVETIYNVYKDEQGRIIYISEMPKSPDDEWFISYKSYFDENGKLFAFSASK